MVQSTEQQPSHPIARALTYTLFFAFVLFLSFAFIRSLVLEVFYTNRGDAAIGRVLTPKERSECVHKVKQLHDELRTEFIAEIRNPWVSSSKPNERWSSWLGKWRHHHTLWQKRCAIPGEQGIKDLYHQLDLESRGLDVMMGDYIRHARTPALAIDDNLKRVLTTFPRH